MSIRLMTWVWANSPYSGERLLLHLALADFANDDGVCFPSHGTLAKKARCSTGWVRQTIKQMIADSLIEIVEPAGQGRGKVGRYRLLKGDTECDLSQSLDDTVASVRSHSDASVSYVLNRHESSNTDIKFEQLWKSYPRKTAKGAARRAFDRVMRSNNAPTLDEMIAAVERYAAQFTTGKIEMTYCAHLATWLNGERWSDEITVEPEPASPQPQVSAEIRTAENLAAAFVHTRRSEADLVESVAPYSPAAQTAALALFRAMKAGTP
ncbi:MAG: hypothetical protein EBS84_21510 [Proteobacteria bacterium]|nr:hypothetical protein [Verrucomicrobiota bacterium]NBU11548.1 hypothetical protein [Pseudomonadota bacterium]NDE96851.1 hypothetical protein [Verrucomicrobiota bacterium]